MLYDAVYYFTPKNCTLCMYWGESVYVCVHTLLVGLNAVVGTAVLLHSLKGMRPGEGRCVQC